MSAIISLEALGSYLILLALSTLSVFLYFKMQPPKRFFRQCRGRGVLVVIAHPDDECMFFAPTILHLSNICQVHILCLSTGNYNQFGKIREQELYNSCSVLGIPKSQVILIDNKDLQDHPEKLWKPEITGLTILEHLNSLRTEIVITFDSYGVSGHLNHQSIYPAVKWLQRTARLSESLKIYTLNSLSLWRKYLLYLELPLAMFSRDPLIVLGPNDFKKAQEAMQAHNSQFVWYRRLYVSFSSYMVINSLRLLR